MLLDATGQLLAYERLVCESRVIVHSLPCRSTPRDSPGSSWPRHEERSRLQFLLELGATENMSILAVIVLAVKFRLLTFAVSLAHPSQYGVRKCATESM